jgi:exopolysaccharide biosynthesis WecB/TagA/CpsF family protein
VALAVDIALLLLASAVAVPALVLAFECFASLLPAPGPAVFSAGARPRVAVLVPARDEEAVVAACVASLRAQIVPGDRLIVVADHCRDRTAAVARDAGAEVLAHDDPAPAGKAHALQAGLNALKGDPPEVVVMVDADTTVDAGALDALARTAAASGRPAQARYLFAAPPEAGPLAAVSAFALVVKNVARPTGLFRLGLPCPLAGSGMAFTWAVAATAPVARESLVEDLDLGLDLVDAGHAPLYCPEAVVRGRLPESRHDARAQRTRWERGHLRTLVRRGPGMLFRGLVSARGEVVAAAADLMVPPLALLVLAGAGALAGALLRALTGGGWLPVAVLAAAASIAGAALIAAWFRWGRPAIPGAAFAAAPLYALWKLPLYLGGLAGRRTRWLRASRSTPRNRRPMTGPETGAPAAVSLRGVRLHVVTERECVARVVEALAAGRGGWIATVNVDHLRRAGRDAAFARLCAEAALAVADGMPLVWASRLQRTALPERVSGSDLLWSLSAAAAASARAVFLLGGGSPDTARKAADALRERHPSLRIAGTHYPEVGFEDDARAMEAITAAVRSARPDIVFVALGSPKQERLIAALRVELPRAWWVPVGIALSFAAGQMQRAPEWMRRAGLEWLYRLKQEPRRLARRYLLDDAPFAIALLGGAAFRGAARALGAARNGG